MFKEIKRTNQYHSFITIKLYSYTICKRENTVVAHFCREYSDLIKTNKRIKNKYWPVPYTKITNNQTRGQEKTVTLLLSPKDFGVGDIFSSTFEGAQYLWRWGEWRGGCGGGGGRKERRQAVWSQFLSPISRMTVWMKMEICWVIFWCKLKGTTLRGTCSKRHL